MSLHIEKSPLLRQVPPEPSLVGQAIHVEKEQIIWLVFRQQNEEWRAYHGRLSFYGDLANKQGIEKVEELRQAQERKLLLRRLRQIIVKKQQKT